MFFIRTNDRKRLLMLDNKLESTDNVFFNLFFNYNGIYRLGRSDVYLVSLSVLSYPLWVGLVSALLVLLAPFWLWLKVIAVVVALLILFYYLLLWPRFWVWLLSRKTKWCSYVGCRGAWESFLGSGLFLSRV